ncbi:MAG: hypothetical protein J0I01_02425 [Stenotrophomonas nitritireducens]|uniref:hypothetical protein n=1 Tax=Stenotrophomonas nitritireducens TaxID=83617 RepID=UPI001ACFD72D|nr:hypothetical protein [Stenotrophomonas nitritireducens]MBN8791073.1 hypothetical protein [Stenotrophomonas nitritireducens]MBN8796540.1 hypothetical protein [Stenotrophomonas nitritireducens]
MNGLCPPVPDAGAGIPARDWRMQGMAGLCALCSLLSCIAVLGTCAIAGLPRGLAQVLAVAAWCLSACFVLYACLRSGVIVSPLGLRFTPRQAGARGRQPVDCWLFLLFFAMLLLSLTGALYLAAVFVIPSFQGNP